MRRCLRAAARPRLNTTDPGCLWGRSGFCHPPPPPPHPARGVQGRGWEPGRVRARLAALIQQHAGVPKQPATVYTGGDVGALAGGRRQRPRLPASPLQCRGTLF